jgi:hypothetical protein
MTKNWSLPRVAFVLWFAFYALFAFAGDFTPNRSSIFQLVIQATVAMFLGLLFFGFMQED